MRVAVPRGWAEAVGIDAAAALPGLLLHVYDITELAAPASALYDAELFIPATRVDAALLQRFSRLRAIFSDGTGVWDFVDVSAATGHRIAVCNVRDYAADALAEFTFGLILAVMRGIAAADRSVRAGEWERLASRGQELKGCTLGVIGFGGTGRRVAQLGEAFGMQVLAYTRNPSPERFPSFVSLHRLLVAADVVTLHLPLQPETHHLLGVAELALLKPTAVLINTARGGLVDQAALVEALRSGRLAGAGLDVLEAEPLPAGDVLRTLANVVLTPHIASQSTQAAHRAVSMALDNVRAFAAGRPQNVVNPEVL